MPEVISKYPEITFNVLKEAGAHCGPEVQPRILTKCPSERFCSLPTGEICVYGLDEIGKTTQISQQEIMAVMAAKLPLVKQPFSFGWLEIFLALFVGLVFGIIISKKPLKSKPG